MAAKPTLFEQIRDCDLDGPDPHLARIQGTTRAVLLILASQADGTGTVNVSHARLAAQLGISTSAVQRALHTLWSAQLLDTLRIGLGRGNSHVFRITWQKVGSAPTFLPAKVSPPPTFSPEKVGPAPSFEEEKVGATPTFIEKVGPAPTFIEDLKVGPAPTFQSQNGVKVGSAPTFSRAERDIGIEAVSSSSLTNSGSTSTVLGSSSVAITPPPSITVPPQPQPTPLSGTTADTEQPEPDRRRRGGGKPTKHFVRGELKPVDEPVRAVLHERWDGPLGGPEAVEQEIGDALDHKAVENYTDLPRYVNGWLKRAADRRAEYLRRQGPMRANGTGPHGVRPGQPNGAVITQHTGSTNALEL